MRRLINLIEGRLPDGFEHEASGLVKFRCATGSGVVAATFEDRNCAIYEFSALGEARRGAGRATLQWLRHFFDVMEVIDPGEVGTEARRFWDRMLSEGLVQALCDDERNPLA